MGIALIFLGLFLWFAQAFNGSVGNTFVNYSFFTSALLMVIAGLFYIGKIKWQVTRIICVLALIAYLPMIWQRFNFSHSVDSGGFTFDILVTIFLLTCIAKNKISNLIDKGQPQ